LARTGRLFASLLTCVVALLAATHGATSRAAERIDASLMVQPASRGSQLDVEVWINKEEGGVYHQGEPMRVSFRANADAFVLIYNIDTEGYIHLVYPYGPDDPDRVEGGITYQVPSRHDPYDLVADGPTGVEYVVAIASPEPFRDLPWYLRGNYEGDEDEYDRNDEDSGVIVGDPYVGMDRVIRRVVPRGLEDEVATDDTYFYIERKVDYPRYVCADCHSYGGWYDPYIDVCTVVDIRIDSAWARYRPWPLRAPIVARPRYFYMVRSTAPTRYRQWKDRWSSADGRTMLRTRFQVDGNDKFRSRREVYQRRMPPELQNLRRSRSGRVWRAPDEVLRRYRDDAARAREGRDGSTLQRQRDMQNGGDARSRDARGRVDPSQDGPRDRGDWRQRNDDRRREWLQRQERRRNEQRQEQQRNEQPQDQQRNDDRQRDQRERQMRERRDDGSRNEGQQPRDDQRREGRDAETRERREPPRRDENRDRGNHESRSEERGGERGRSSHDKPDRGDRGGGNGRHR
jgi:hypothetical protein